MRLTAKVAETIGEILKEKGIEVDSFFVRDANKADIRNYDCLLAGAPTMAFRASSGIMQFLNGLSSKESSGKLAAAFDTQARFVFSGSASKGIENKLKNLGFGTFVAPLVTYVEGKQNEMRLKVGELDKTKSWAQEVAKVLLTKK